MTDLRDKRILLIAPLGQYSEAIEEALRARGAVVDCYEERPALNALAKTLIRYSPRLIRSYTQAYFDRIIIATKRNDYDFVLLIRAEAVTRKFIRDLRACHKSAEILLYQWDSMTLTKGPIDKLDLVDRHFSFDKRDCAAYSMTFVPLFYIDDYRDVGRSACLARYDFAFVGTIHSDRFKLIRQIEQYAHAHSLSSYFYMFIPSPAVFYKLKYLDRNLPGAARSDFRYVHLSKSRAVQAMADARIVIDSEHPAQIGLTMRTIETLGARRKLITTNPDVMNYDFYDPNNILVVSRDRLEIPDSFISARYIDRDSDIYGKYSVHSWVSTIFQLNTGCVPKPRDTSDDTCITAQNGQLPMKVASRKVYPGDSMRATSPQSGWEALAKRAVDVVGSLGGLVLLFPLFVAISALVWFSMGRPILFRQKRPGRYAKPFDLVKFRTMADLRDESGKLLSDAERLTRVGRFLRATSLDELPQLWNVLRGDISLVGPRPLLMSYLPRYSPQQARRHEVLPGITGWAQVNGRNGLTWEEKFELDVWYVDHWSLWLDLRILAETVKCVLLRRGVSSDGHATMPEFIRVPELLTTQPDQPGQGSALDCEHLIMSRLDEGR